MSLHTRFGLRLLGVVWFALPATATTVADNQDIQIVPRPEGPFIERRDSRQFVNFDLLVRNNTQRAFRLVAIRLAVIDRTGRLELARELNENGKPPALDMIGDRVIPGGALVDIYQPFYEFGPEVDLTRMRMEFLFMEAAKPAPPVSIVADRVIAVNVQPRKYYPAAYCLPLRGLILVHDGHDFYSHHRRYDLAERFKADPHSAVAANLYAYDFMRTTPEGVLFRGDAHRKENWLSYGEPILAPASGLVIAAVSNLPENSFDEKGEAQFPSENDAKDPNGFGNYVTIRHVDGRVSWMLHMQPGSVLVKVGEHVRLGQLIGKIGFTGDSLFPHLHYTVTDAPSYPSQSVPSYFKGFTRHLGIRGIRSTSGQVDTGDLVESDTTCR
jgi:hypothetical protein